MGISFPFPFVFALPMRVFILILAKSCNWNSSLLPVFSTGTKREISIVVSGSLLLIRRW